MRLWPFDLEQEGAETLMTLQSDSPPNMFVSPRSNLRNLKRVCQVDGSLKEANTIQAALPRYSSNDHIPFKISILPPCFLQRTSPCSLYAKNV